MRTSRTISPERDAWHGHPGRVPAAVLHAARGQHARATDARATLHVRGFTLTEMLVIVALIGLLAGASGNVAYNTYRRYLVEKAARQLYLAARYAHLFAVEQHQQCRVVLDKTGRRFFVMVEQPNADVDVDETPIRVIANSYTKPTEFAGAVEFEQINVLSTWEGALQGVRDGTVITFYPDGTADMSAIQVGDGLNHFAVYVAAATGKARVEFGQAAEAPIEVVDLDMEGYR